MPERLGQHDTGPWSLRLTPRAWQNQAFEKWQSSLRGVVSVVTGGGKTQFAFQCMVDFRNRYPAGQFVVIVPTVALLDQWAIAAQDDLGVMATDIACYSSGERPARPRQLNILVINSGRELMAKFPLSGPAMLIVDECHRAGSPENAKALAGKYTATLGLSATPQREYDPGFEDHVVPALGPVIFEYDYADAFRDHVVAPFDLINVQIALLLREREEYGKLTRRAAVMYARTKIDPSLEPRLKRLLQRRAAVSAQAAMRVPVAARIVDEHRGIRTIIFHERVASATLVAEILKKRNHSVCLYHSKIAPDLRRDNLRLFRQGVFDVLVSCRALDEGMNIPEVSVAVIASSTASRRQRIQRLGRVLRPAPGKSKAIIYTIFATQHEHSRLLNEAQHLDGVAQIIWATGTRGANHG